MSASALPPQSLMEPNSSDALTPALPFAMAPAALHVSGTAKLQRQLSGEEWNELRSLIHRLYMFEKKTFLEVADILSKHHGFRPTKKQFSSKIAEWGFKKNMNKKERRELLHTLRPVEEETLIDSMGREHKRQKIERWENEIKKETFGNPEHIAASTNFDVFKARRGSEPSSQAGASADGVVSQLVVNMEVDIATPIVEAEGERRVWIQDPEEFRYFPFARWANVDVQGSPNLTRLFADLTLETNGLPDDIELLILPAPCVEPTTSGVREYITCSELMSVCHEDNGELLSWNDDINASDAETRLVITPTRRSPSLRPFKISASDAWFPSGEQMGVSQLRISPFNELYPFPTSVSRWSKGSQIPGTLAQSDKMEEIECTRKLEYLKKTGIEESHPVVFEVTRRLARALYVRGKDKEAEVLCRKLLSAERSTHRSQSVDTISIQLDLINALRNQGRLLEAKEIHEVVHAVIVKTCLPHHELFRRSMFSMNTILERTGKEEEEEGISRQLAQICLVHLGPNDPETLDVLYRLAYLMRRRKRYIESKRLHRILLELYFRAHGQLHANICSSFIDLAMSLEAQGEIEEAIKHYRSAAERAKVFLGDEHLTTMKCNYSLGVALRQKDPGQSEELLRVTAKLQTRALGEDHYNTLYIVCELGVTLYESGKVQECEEWMEKCFHRALNNFDLESEPLKLIISSCDYLGSCYESQRRYPDALELYQELLGRLRGATEVNHLEISKIQGWIDFVHRIVEEQAQDEGSDWNEGDTSLNDYDSDNESTGSSKSVALQDMESCSPTSVSANGESSPLAKES